MRELITKKPWIRRWEMDSHSSNSVYIVGLKTDGTLGCSCPAWKFRREECKHIREVKQNVVTDFRDRLVQKISAYIRVAGKSLMELTQKEFRFSRCFLPGQKIPNLQAVNRINLYKDVFSFFKGKEWLTKFVTEKGSNSTGELGFNFNITGRGKNASLIARVMNFNDSDEDARLEQKLRSCFPGGLIFDTPHVEASHIGFFLKVFLPNVYSLGMEISKCVFSTIISFNGIPPPELVPNREIPPAGWRDPDSVDCRELGDSIRDVFRSGNLSKIEPAFFCLDRYLDNLKEMHLKDFGELRYSKYFMKHFLDSYAEKNSFTPTN